MKIALMALALSACAHVQAATDFSRAVDAELERCVNELLTSGACAHKKVAMQCEDSSVLLEFGGDAVFFDRTGKKLGRSFGPHLRRQTEGRTTQCTKTLTEVHLFERALWRVKRVSVSLRTTLGTESVKTDARAGHRLMLGTVEGIVGFGEHGPVVLTLRRVPEGISVLGGDVAPGAAMQELHERATIELPARITTVEGNEWSTFTIELVREVFERNDPPSVPLTSS